MTILRRTLLVALLAYLGPGSAQVFQIGSGVASPVEFAELGLLFDADGNPGVASGVITLSFDPARVAAEERCRSRAGGTIFSTHRIACSVDGSLGEITITFESLVIEVPQTLPGRWNFGAIALQLLAPTELEPPAELTLQSTVFRDINDAVIPGGGPVEEPGLAYFVEGWPVDAFEIDDTPVEASNLNRFSRSIGSTRVRAEQLHSFDSDNDEDWILNARRNSLLGGPSLEVRSLAPQLPDAFQPVVEIYDLDRLFDANAAPVQVIGTCDGSPRELFAFTDELQQSRLLRVTNCVPPPAEGLPYRLVREAFLGTISGGAVARGTVTEAGTGLPVKVIVYSDSNQITVSDPSDGAYSIVLLRDQETTLSVVSDRYVADTVTIEALEEGAISEGNNLVVRRTPEDLFADGFETPQ